MAKLDIRHHGCDACKVATTPDEHCGGCGTVPLDDDGCWAPCECPCGDEPPETFADWLARKKAERKTRPADEAQRRERRACRGNLAWRYLQAY